MKSRQITGKNQGRVIYRDNRDRAEKFAPVPIAILRGACRLSFNRKNFLLKKCRKIRDFPVLTAFLNI